MANWVNSDHLLTVHTSNKLLRNALILSREPRAPMKYVSSELTILQERKKAGVKCSCVLLCYRASPVLCAAVVGDPKSL